MEFLEKNLEEIIFESDKDKLRSRGLYISGKLYRQLRIGNYGIADLVEVNRDRDMLHITVYELKKDKIGISAFLQAVGYLKGIKRYIENTRGKGFYLELSIILIGKNLDLGSTFCYLPYLLPENCLTGFLNCYTYSYDVDGLVIKETGEHSLINEGFKPHKK